MTTDLELQLRDLAAHLDVPDAPPLLDAVLPRLTPDARRRRLLVVAVATGTAALLVALVVPGSRASLLRFFHIQGATVTMVDRLPPLATHRPLGRPVSLDRVPFRLLLPNGRRPEQVYAGDGGYWLRYRGLLLFEFESGGAEILKKVVLGTTEVEPVRVDGEPGIWIGGHHGVYFPGGPPVSSGHALVWQHGLLTLRLEAAVGRRRALAIARTVR